MTQTLSVATDTPTQLFGHFEDRDLSRRIIGFLTFHGLLREASIVLQVVGGHVELRGTVTTFRKREQIDAFTRRVAGVHNVTNQLVVGPIPFGSRQVLGDDLQQELTGFAWKTFIPSIWKRGA